MRVPFGLWGVPGSRGYGRKACRRRRHSHVSKSRSMQPRFCCQHVQCLGAPPAAAQKRAWALGSVEGLLRRRISPPTCSAPARRYCPRQARLGCPRLRLGCPHALRCSRLRLGCPHALRCWRCCCRRQLCPEGGSCSCLRLLGCC